MLIYSLSIGKSYFCAIWKGIFKIMIYNTTVTIYLTLLHSEWPKLYTILAFLSAIGLKSICHFRDVRSVLLNVTFILFLLENPVSKQCRPRSDATLSAYDPFTGFQVRMG